MSNESIREAVAEFAAESEDFNSPNAEAKWGRIADWNVSEVASMKELFRNQKKFNGDVSKWDVGNVTDMFVSRFPARALAAVRAPLALVAHRARRGGQRVAMLRRRCGLTRVWSAARARRSTCSTAPRRSTAT